MISHTAALGDKTKQRTPNLSSLTVFCTFGALWFGVIAVLGFHKSTDAAAVFAALLAFASLMGVSLFLSLARASAYGRALAEKEGPGVEGVGRIGGRLTGLVVIATDQRIIAIPGRLFRRPKISTSIPYQEILSFDANDDFFYVQSRAAVISLIKCSPIQVEALAGQLRKRVSG